MWAAPLDLIGLSVASLHPSPGLVRRPVLLLLHSSSSCVVSWLQAAKVRRRAARPCRAVPSSPSACRLRLLAFPVAILLLPANARCEVPTSSPSLPPGKGGFGRPSQVAHHDPQVPNHQIPTPASGWGWLNYCSIRFSLLLRIHCYSPYC